MFCTDVSIDDSATPGLTGALMHRFGGIRPWNSYVKLPHGAEPPFLLKSRKAVRSQKGRAPDHQEQKMWSGTAQGCSRPRIGPIIYYQKYILKGGGEYTAKNTALQGLRGKYGQTISSLHYGLLVRPSLWKNSKNWNAIENALSYAKREGIFHFRTMYKG